MTAPADLFVILNPVAGRNAAAVARQRLVAACLHAGKRCEFHATAPGDNVTDIARAASQRGHRLIVAGGGDGTISQVAAGLRDSSTPLGILPIGTANLLARELGLPLELTAACRLLAEDGPLRPLDALAVHGRLCLSHVSLGLYALIAERTSRRAKRYLRPWIYLWNVLPELLRGQVWPFELELDGVRHEIEASLIVAANVGGVGGRGLRWGPDITPDDGRIDLCIVRTGTLAGYRHLVQRISAGGHADDPDLLYLSARERIVVRMPAALPVRGDGEILGHGLLDATVLPAALQVRAPAVSRLHRQAA